jgi:precorrin-2/cobalt-factor-2 C20-methyltransferase
MNEKTGTLYGVGVGPGDPELLTLKAQRVLNECPVIAAPQTKSGEMLALDIVKNVVSLEGKTILPLYFTMERDRGLQHAAHLHAADEIETYLAAGQDVAMLNLGDVSIYATWGYVMEIMEERGYRTVMIPGVTSFCAVAARLGISLTDMNDRLHIVPASGVPLEEALSQPGTKILMKSGKHIPSVVKALEEKGLLECASMVCNCGLPDEAVYRDMRNLPDKVGYFATIIVKEKH